MSIIAYFIEAKWKYVFVPLVVLTLYFVSLHSLLSWLLPDGQNVNTVFAYRAGIVSLFLLLLAAGVYLILFVFKVFFKTLKGTHVIILLCLLALGSVSFYFLLSWLSPEYIKYVKAVFAYRDRAVILSLFILLLATGLYILFIALKIFQEKKRGNQPTDSKERLLISDFVLVLLPLTPVVQYILNNHEILSPLGSLYVLAAFAAFSALLVIVIPALLGVVGSTSTLMILGLAFTFTITNMASLSAGSHWFEVGRWDIQLVLFSAVFLIGWVLYNLIGRKFMYLIVVVFFISNSAIQLAPGDWAKTAPISTDNKLVELVGSKEPLSTPSIYLLVYDAYVINETMLGYGIDNNAQEKYLETLGFTIYPHTYSVGAESILTMSRVLNASTEYYGYTRRGVSGDGVVQNLLKSYGYETYGIFESDYFFQGIGSSYDFSFPEVYSSRGTSSSHNVLIKAILMGEFRFDVGFYKVRHEQFVEHKLSVFESVTTKPKFVYVHVMLPMHGQNSGECLPNEIALFEKRLVMANNEMKYDIETITQKDPGAIIVVAGDHGPYLTKNCTLTDRHYGISEISRLDIQDRFGTFLAIKWPTEDFSEYDSITVLQDLFPTIFAYLFSDDSLLEAKVASTTLEYTNISGASVKNGIIYGGINAGEPLFVDRR